MPRHKAPVLVGGRSSSSSSSSSSGGGASSSKNSGGASSSNSSGASSSNSDLGEAVDDEDGDDDAGDGEDGSGGGGDDAKCVVCKSGWWSAATGPILLCDSILIDDRGDEYECPGAAHLRCSDLGAVPGKGVEWLCWSCCDVPTPSRSPLEVGEEESEESDDSDGNGGDDEEEDDDVVDRGGKRKKRDNDAANRLSFTAARAFARTLKLESTRQWREYNKSGKRPSNIVSDPHRTYRDAGWISYPDWLGYEEERMIRGSALPFAAARTFAQTL